MKDWDLPDTENGGFPILWNENGKRWGLNNPYKDLYSNPIEQRRKRVGILRNNIPTLCILFLIGWVKMD